MGKLRVASKAPDPVRFDDVMLRLSEARAARFLLHVVTNPDTAYSPHRLDEPQLDEHESWIRSHALDWLRDCHDAIEREYRKVRAGNENRRTDDPVLARKRVDQPVAHRGAQHGQSACE